MKVEIVVDPGKQPAASLASRVAPLPAACVPLSFYPAEAR
jgi:hypothetical protein